MQTMTLSSALISFYSDPRANCVFLSLLTALSWSFADLQSGITANAGTDINLISFAVSAGFLALSVCVTLSDPGVAPAPIKRWSEALATALLGCCGIVDNSVYVYAQKMIPVGDVALLSNMSLIYTPFLDSLRRRHLPTAPQFIGIFLSAAGVILVTQPSFIFGTYLNDAEYSRQAVGYILGFCTGASITADAMLVSVFKGIPLSNWMLSISAALFISGCIGAAIEGGVAVASTPLVAVALTTMVTLSSVGQFANVLSTKSHTPTLMALVTVLQVPLTYAWGWIWLDQEMNWVKILGVILVFVAVTIVICDARWKEDGEEESIRLTKQ